MKIRKKEETRPSNSDHGKLSILEKRQQARKRKKKSGGEKFSEENNREGKGQQGE